MNAFVFAASRLLVPAILLALALILRPQIPSIGADPLTLLNYLPYLLALIGVALSIQFNRSRFLLLTLATALAYWLVQNYLQVSLSDPGAARFFNFLAFGVPAFVLGLLLIEERGIFNLYGLTYLAGAAILGLVVWQGTALVEGYAAQGSHWFVLWPGESYVMSRGASLANSAVLLLALGLLIRRGDHTEVALLGTLVAGWILLALFYLPQVSIAIFVATGLLQISSLIRSSHAMAYRDELTGLLGRRALNERLRGLGGRYCLAMVDIDHFKKVNDTHGHDVGDDVLKLVASQLSRHRGSGTCFRYGGEEFCVLFPRRSADECIETLQLMRKAIAEYEITLRDQSQRPSRSADGAKRRGSRPRGAVKIAPGNLAVTISIGLAEKNESLRTPEEVIVAADKQLYKAKKQGRNRVCY